MAIHRSSTRYAAIETMPAAYARAPWIEIEAKNKEEAIRGLRQWQAAAA